MRQLKITKQVTNRETASLDKYLQEIGKVDLITADEEVELAQRIKAGDQLALEKLTKANLRFVVSVANNTKIRDLHYRILSMKVTSDLSKPHSVLMKPVDSNSYPMRYGGYVNPFYRHWPSNPVSCVCL